MTTRKVLAIAVLAGLVAVGAAWSDQQIQRLMPLYGTLYSTPAGETLVYAGDCRLTWDLEEQKDGSLVVRGLALFSNVTVRGLLSGIVYRIPDLTLAPAPVPVAPKMVTRTEQIRLYTPGGAPVGLLSWNLMLSAAEPGSASTADRLCVSCSLCPG